MEYLHQLLSFAVKQGASDVHLKSGAHPVLRISRELYDVEMEPLTEKQLIDLVMNILPIHLVEPFNNDHEADFSHVEKDVGRFRTNVFQQRGLLAMAMRHVKAKIPTFDEINLPSALLKPITKFQNGIVLLAGVTGSGKSTTLATMLDYINQQERLHIITAEDPIEYAFEDKKSIIEQREIGLDTPSFQTALKRVLRQDPNIIMVGEMRDAESFMAALAAADTGHLVFSSIHTSNASASVGRILDFFPHEERDQIRSQLAVTLRAVICQRLVPAIVGGIVPALEIMVNSPSVRKLLEENRLEKLPAAIETGTEDGMQTFNQALFKLIKEKKITERDALEKAGNRAALEMNLKGIFLSESRSILG